jgi:primary-amine oxidase
LAEKYVRWLDWTFFVGIDHATGVGLFDVRHKDERVLYELSMQEALAHYTGSDPVNSGIAFLDSHDSFATNARPLIPGYDCPAHASYMNISYFLADTVLQNVNSICLFESDTDHPIARHYAAGYVAATKNTKFVLRWVATIRNYDCEDLPFYSLL